MVLETRLEQRPDVRLCVYRDFRPSLVFYARRHVERADNLGELQAFLHQPGEEVVVMDTDRLAGLGEGLLSVLRKIAVQGRQVALAKRPDATAEMMDPSRARRYGAAWQSGGGGTGKSSLGQCSIVGTNPDPNIISPPR